jgi:hypothetical protein
MQNKVVWQHTQHLKRRLDSVTVAACSSNGMQNAFKNNEIPKRLTCLLITVSSDITRVSLRQTGCTATDAEVNAVRITPTYAYACWLLRDFSD